MLSRCEIGFSCDIAQFAKKTLISSFSLQGVGLGLGFVFWGGNGEYVKAMQGSLFCGFLFFRGENQGVLKKKKIGFLFLSQGGRRWREGFNYTGRSVRWWESWEL